MLQYIFRFMDTVFVIKREKIVNIASFFSEKIIPVFCMPSGLSAPIVKSYKHAGLLNTDLFSIWRTEYGAGLGAVGFSCSTGKASLLVLAAGPGITNAITAVKQAFEESLPVIVLEINNFSSVLNRRVGSMHEIPDSTVFFTSITCWQQKITDARDFYEVLSDSIEKASLEKSPIYLEIPNAVLMKVEECEIPLTVSGVHRKHCCELTDEFIDDLIESSRPIIIAGYGTVLSKCVSDVEKLASMLNVPLVLTIKAVSYYQNTVQNCGAILDRILTVEQLAEECDLVIVLGSSFSYLNTANNRLKFGGKIYRFIIQEPFETMYDITDFRSDASLATKSLIDLINRKVPPKNYVCPFELIKKQKDIFEKETNDVIYYMDILQTYFSENAMFVFDLCLQTYIFQRVWNTAKQQRFVLSFSWGNLGSSLPMSIGMLITGAENRVVCICGDGGLSYSIGDLSLLDP